MKTILVIDDDDQFRGMLQRMLEKAGHRVLVACDGGKGLQLFEQCPADLVVTDLIMPDVEGLETIMKLRVLSPGVKIVAVSGGGRSQPDDYLAMAHALGACRCFAKPFDRKEFLGAIDEILAD